MSPIRAIIDRFTGRSHAGRGQAPGAAARVILVGSPNVGKSALFNRLTGRYNLVANYPLTTLEMRSAEATLAGALETLVGIIDGLTLDESRAVRAASGLLLATDVADYLVSRGVPFRRAHELTGRMVRRLLAEGRDFSALTLDEWRAESDLFDERILDVVTPRASVMARRTPQSTHPAAVDAALADVRAWLASLAACPAKTAGS